ncbi:hypothetical protein GGR54DRAFT_162235 [Hypoxylon sp. NC1633]|nr:hypothetical protein GGR54DRAFT_162235 [Hypoxylon sp. NC1633]
MINACGHRSTSTRSLHDMDGPLAGELSLYNGISNRSRGWKTKKSDNISGMRQCRSHGVMRWDGASMSSKAWDNLKRDTELWHRDGNCYIHLYGQGQSRRGPAFKVPFSRLLEADCYPLIDRYMAQDVLSSTDYIQDDKRDPARRSRIELFIPAPPRLDKQQSYKYHLATRNFFAFLFRRSVVGDNLGAALITLMHSMHEFRTDDADNARDLISYLDEEGYLNFRRHPTHALAILRLAEAFQLRDLYINAFAHCCGMSDQLSAVPEYQLVSPVSRKLIRCARVEMNLRLGQSANMLGTFLEYEMSEAHLGLYSGARAHLERFRSLLQDFYAARFGSYPPPSVDSRTTIFEVNVFQTMRTDFEALFQYLVDDKFDITQNSPFLAQGGICIWQSVQSFDMRHEFKTLFHPLPLLPKVSQDNIKKGLWMAHQIRSNQRQRDNTYFALVKATNQRHDLLKNGLVRAYRQFEEDLVYSSTKADKLENLGPMDSRKVRWILIYGIYQALRQATDIPPEVRDAAGAPYHLCVSTADLPPWDGERPVYTLAQSQTDHIVRSTSPSTTDRGSIISFPRQRSFEIKPDIDYLAITHRESTSKETKEGGSRLRRAASWRGSLTRNLSMSLRPQRSAARLTKPQPDKTAQSTHKSPYHEIVVQGYGNGTNDIKATLAHLPPPMVRTAIAEEDQVSTSPSPHSSTSDFGNSEEESVAKTSDTSVCESTPRATCAGCGHGDLQQSGTPARGPGSTCTGFRRKLQEEVAFDPSCGLISRRRSRSLDGGDARWRMVVAEPKPRSIHKVHSVAACIEMPAPKAPTAWDHVKAVMEVKATSWTTAADVHPEWERYTDLGGLTEIRSDAPVAATVAAAAQYRSSTVVHF